MVLMISFKRSLKLMVSVWVIAFYAFVLSFFWILLLIVCNFSFVATIILLINTYVLVRGNMLEGKLIRCWVF